MRKIFDQKCAKELIAKSRHRAVLETLPPMFLTVYAPGEFIGSPFEPARMFRVIAEGSFDIYYVRSDGSRYALSSGSRDYLLGDVDVFHMPNDSIFTEARERVVCLTLSLEAHDRQLRENAAFMALIAESLSDKISAMTGLDAQPRSLEERVLTYMKCKCPDRTLKGIEQHAFRLHCSARQLQRIMNRFTEKGVTEKIGKGHYRLKHAEAPDEVI